MPSLPSISSPIPNVPPPAPAIGSTDSAVKNFAMGAVQNVGTNLATSSFLGPDVFKAALAINLIFQFVKHLKFNQHLWAPLILAAMGIGLFIIVNGDVRQSVLDGCAAAVQAMLNYHGFRVAGINILPAAPDPKE